jgi:hypothetical protein
MVKIDLGTWEPYQMDEIDNEKFNTLRMDFEKMLYMIPADVLGVWQAEFYGKLRNEASVMYNSVVDHMKRP